MIFINSKFTHTTTRTSTHASSIDIQPSSENVTRLVLSIGKEEMSVKSMMEAVGLIVFCYVFTYASHLTSSKITYIDNQCIIKPWYKYGTDVGDGKIRKRQPSIITNLLLSTLLKSEVMERRHTPFYDYFGYSAWCFHMVDINSITRKGIINYTRYSTIQIWQ